jgi:hypothetical protein
MRQCRRGGNRDRLRNPRLWPLLRTLPRRLLRWPRYGLCSPRVWLAVELPVD